MFNFNRIFLNQQKSDNKDKETEKKNIPKHVAIICDGNGRWAKQRGLPRSFGHKAGVKPMKCITQECARTGVKILTLFAFSTENWKRDRNEVDFLMKLFVDFFREWREEIRSKGIQFHHIGLKENLPEDLLYEIELTEKVTMNNNQMIVNVALNYGGRQEVVNAVQAIAKDVQYGKLMQDDINEDTIHNYLYTKGQDDPDILIRTSGEFRVSNFLLWQLAKTQIWTTQVLWPDFKSEHLQKAFECYQPYRTI
ncbi:undecaprenyl diphosphate synthase [Anaerovirgula multivorans]|uniref:Isoprenyl transferase n=1 Tax=Anaerovirgula multivorans TaxID=312168 RepID=A0A239GQ65_9FIRM|nr:isoprenyl transferase [Anaerovirgula multivorans]SNS70928.1 undecaprenyl diphosphate synthase [Anaerovirgula multivorans]